jgi:Na+/phosphate symporter
MKKETLKELGKASFGLGNMVTGLSIINGLFGTHPTAFSQPLTSIIVAYIFIITYGAGIILLEKGSNDD